MRTALTLLLVASCTRAPSWPAWPQDRDAARELIEAQTVRAPGASEPTILTAEAVAEQVRLRTLAGETRVGWPAIVAWLQHRVDAHPERPFYLLWGTYHDASAQIEALARVLGLLGVDARWQLVAEPFAATGRWAGVPEDCQRGDEPLLDEWRATGGRTALGAVMEDQRIENHTARRYGVLDAMAELLVTTRAAGVPVLGCDPPTCLRERLWDVSDPESMRTRELHCVLALRRTLGTEHPPERVAMLWGLSHVHADGVARFLPSDAEVLSIHVIGGRLSDTSIGSAVARRHGLTDPVLLPGEQPILLLSDHRSFARHVRKRDDDMTPPELAGQVYAFSTVPGELILPGGRIQLDLESIRVPAEPGHLPFVFVGRKRALVGGIDFAEGAWLEIEIDPRDRMVATVSHPANPAVGHTERL